MYVQPCEKMESVSHVRISFYDKVRCNDRIACETMARCLMAWHLSTRPIYGFVNSPSTARSSSFHIVGFHIFSYRSVPVPIIFQCDVLRFNFAWINVVFYSGIISSPLSWSHTEMGFLRLLYNAILLYSFLENLTHFTFTNPSSQLAISCTPVWCQTIHDRVPK